MIGLNREYSMNLLLSPVLNVYFVKNNHRTQNSKIVEIYKMKHKRNGKLR